MRKRCLESIYELATEDERVVFIGSDLGYKTLDNFRRDMPERFFMEGVCEANIVGMAAGLAMDGRIPYLNTIATFLTRRCFEQLVVDLCLHNLKVRLVGNGAGLVYAPLGPTHIATEDIAILRAIPNMTIVAPADADEMGRLMPKTLDYPGPIYIRLAKGYDPIVSSSAFDFEIAKGILMRGGGDALIVSTGITLGLALEVADAFSSRGVAVAVLHMHTLKPLDEELLMREISRVSVVVTVEEHSLVGGLGSSVAELVAEADFPSQKRFRRLALPDSFPGDYGSQASLMRSYGITRERLFAHVEALLRSSGES